MRGSTVDREAAVSRTAKAGLGAIWWAVVQKRFHPWDVLRLILAGLLLTAGLLKTYPWHSLLPATSAWLPRRVIPVVGQMELLFAVWLVYGWYPAVTRCVATAVFGGFGAVSLIQALSGEKA